MAPSTCRGGPQLLLQGIRLLRALLAVGAPLLRRVPALRANRLLPEPVAPIRRRDLREAKADPVLQRLPDVLQAVSPVRQPCMQALRHDDAFPCLCLPSYVEDFVQRVIGPPMSGVWLLAGATGRS